MVRNVYDDRIDGVLGRVFGDDDGPVYVADASASVVEAVVDALSALDEPPEVRLLAHEDAFKAVFEDFLVGSEAADHVASDHLSLRVAAEEGANPTVIANGRVTSLVDAGARVGGLRTDEADLVEAAREDVDERWAAAEEYSLRTPPMSAVREELGEDLDAAVQEDFTGMLDSLETARGDGDDLDEVTVSLLAAAKNEALLYDISRWGEDTGLASKATFSRTKSSLEDAGLIDTEKVPIEVGRPRLRLTLADERLRDADPDQLAAAAQTVLN
jgi:DNA-binding transcriptional ArsR family regulator